MTPNGKPALLFDLDGTLVDSIELILQSAAHAFSCRPERPAPSREAFALGIGRPLRDQFAPYCNGSDEVEFLIARYREYQLTHHDRLTTAYPGVVEAVATLAGAGYRLAVVTSKMDAMARRALRHVGLDQAITVVIGCDATERHKPDPAPVILALERLQSRAGNAIFFGDSPYDMMAGRAAGVMAVAALWGAFSRDDLERAGAHHALAQPTDIPGFVHRHVGAGRTAGTA